MAISFRSRDELASIIGPQGIAVEIGVYEGGFSRILLDGSEGQVVGVDPYHKYPDDMYSDRVNSETSQAEQEARYRGVLLAMKGYGDRYRLMRAESVQVAIRFEDDCCDLVYIDGNHCYRTVSEDLVAWWPKVRPGGYLAGHDWATAGTGVERAVSEFSSRTGREVALIPGRGSGQGQRSWMMRK